MINSNTIKLLAENNLALEILPRSNGAQVLVYGVDNLRVHKTREVIPYDVIYGVSNGVMEQVVQGIIHKHIKYVEENTQKIKVKGTKEGEPFIPHHDRTIGVRG